MPWTFVSVWGTAFAAKVVDLGLYAVLEDILGWANFPLSSLRSAMVLCDDDGCGSS